MSIPEAAHWLQQTGWATDLRESALVYPIILVIHLTCIAIFGGMIFATNLRLCNVAFKEAPVAEVIARLRPWKQAGFVIMVTCGILLASAKADEYYKNPYFLIKMTLLALTAVHAQAFRKTVYRNPAPPASSKARLAAAISLVLWFSILSMGRWIAYYEAPKG